MDVAWEIGAESMAKLFSFLSIILLLLLLFTL